MKKLISILLSITIVFSCFVYIPTVKVKAATTSQQNIVGWADYYYGITWTAKKTIAGWHSSRASYTLTGGNTYRIPYAQPISRGAYIGYGASVDTFLSAANDVNSVFYTSTSANGSCYSTYYGMDCSSFVSSCWGIPRSTTWSIPNRSTNLGQINSSTINSLQIGDCLNSTSAEHVVLVTDVTYSGSTVTSVEITEQTPPQLKRTTYSASSLVSYYGSRGYYIYRYNGTVPTPPNTSQEPEDNYVNLGTDFYAVIKNTKYNNYVSKVEGSNDIYLQEGNDSSRQIWYFEQQEDGAYAISSCYDGKYLEMTNGVRENGTQITAHDDFWGGNYQQWYIIDAGDGYKLKSKHYTSEGWYLDRSGNGSNKVQIFEEFEDASDQTWTISKEEAIADIGDKFYSVISNTKHGDCVSKVTDTNNVYVKEKDNSSKQVWYFERQEDGAYAISSCYDGKYLEMTNGVRENKTQISAHDNFWGGNYQQWYLIPSGNGYRILSKHYTGDGWYLDRSARGDSVVQIYEKYAVMDDQVWTIDKEAAFADLGDNFDAVISNTKYSSVISRVEDSDLIFLKDKDNSKKQGWNFIRQSDGAYVIYSKVDGKVLEMSSGITENRTQISVAGTYWGGNYQQWYLVPSGDGYRVLSKHYTSQGWYLDRSGSGDNHLQIYEKYAEQDDQIWSLSEYKEHKWKEATCTEKKTCTICGATEGSVLGHNYTSKVTKEATCTENGVKTYTCSRCSNFYTEAISAKGHSWKSATCTAKKTCSTCGATDGNALGHNYTSKITKEATCTANGVKTYTCSRCNNSYTESIPVKGHTEVIDKAVAPTCTETGLTEGKHCSVCKKVLVAQKVVAKKGHTEVIDKAVAPTYTSTGLTEGSHCSVCNKVIIEQMIIPTIISYTDEKTNIKVDLVGENIKLNITEINDENTIANISNQLNNQAVIKIYDISLLSRNSEMNPYNQVKIKIPASNQNSAIYKYETDGSITNMNALYDDGFMVFTTNLLGTFALTADNEGSTPSKLELGDVNGDDKINILDVTEIQKHLAKLTELTSEQKAAADTNNDGKINILDATQIQKYLAKLIFELG